MEKSEFYDMFPIFAMVIWMIVMKHVYLPEPWYSVSFFGLLVTIVLCMFATEVIYKFVTSESLFIEAFTAPSGERLRFFVKDVESRKLGFNQYSTVLKLRWKIKHRDFGKIDKIVINHTRSFYERVIFRPGWAVYAGQRIKHPQTAVIVLDEEPGSNFDVDHVTPIPVYRLRWALGDYQLPEEKREAAVQPIVANGGKPQAEKPKKWWEEVGKHERRGKGK
jgi:hypothetical protein